MCDPPEPKDFSVLIVEDEFLVALDMVDALENAGYRVQGPFSQAQAALDEIASRVPDAAVLDVHLTGDETTERIAQRLHAMAIPIIFASAAIRGDIDFIGEDTALLSKPIPHDLLLKEIGVLAAKSGTCLSD